MVSGDAIYAAYTGSLLSRIHAVASLGTSGAITITDPIGSTVLSGTGFLMEGGLNFPKGASGQPFSFRVNNVTTP